MTKTHTNTKTHKYKDTHKTHYWYSTSGQKPTSVRSSHHLAMTMANKNRRTRTDINKKTDKTIARHPALSKENYELKVAKIIPD